MKAAAVTPGATSTSWLANLRHGIARREWELRFALRIAQALHADEDRGYEIVAAELQRWPDQGADAAWLTETPEGAADRNLADWLD